MNKKVLIIGAIVVLLVLWLLGTMVAIPGISYCHWSDMAGAGEHCHWMWGQTHIH